MRSWRVAGTGLCAAGLGVAALMYASIGRDAQWFGRSVRCGPGRRRVVALTFDDGPSPGTVELAEYLASEGIRATFFLCGMNVLRHPEIGRELHAAGHELGNHTFSHPRLSPRLGWDLNLLTPGAVYREFAQAQAAIAACTGFHPRLLRAPYGMRWWGMGKAQRELGLVGVMWTVIGHDWEWSAERVARHVLGRATAGGIICLHDGRDTRAEPDVSVTLAAVRQIVDGLKRMGYGFVTVSELLS